MKRLKTFTWLLWLLPFCITTHADNLEKAQQLFQDQNFKEALEICQNHLKDPKTSQPAEFLELAINSLSLLSKPDLFDETVEGAVATFPNNFELLHQAAGAYASYHPKHGFVIDNRFERADNRRTNTTRTSCAERDRVRALQLFEKAEQVAKKGQNPAKSRPFYENFYHALMNVAYTREKPKYAWRLQLLTDTSILPDYGDLDHETADGAPVDEQGSPIFYEIPETYQNAANDGERMRWILHQFPEGQLTYAQFLRHQFGVQTLQNHPGFDQTFEASFNLHELQDSETYAKLANGMQKITLPEAHNFIKIYQKALEQNPLVNRQLAEIFELRQQFPKALSHWQAFEKEYDSSEVAERIANIVEARCQLSVHENTQPAGKGAELELKFRNAQNIHFSAKAIDLAGLMAAYKTYLKTSQKRDWQRDSLYNLGQALQNGWAKEFVKEEVAAWDLAVTPAPDYFEKQQTVTTPLQTAGLYLITASTKDGSESSVMLQLTNAIIVRKDVDQANLFIVTDALTGKPLPKLTVEFFGVKTEWKDGKQTRLFKNFAEFTDKSGQILLNDEALKGYQLTTFLNDQGYLAFLSPNHVGWRSLQSYRPPHEKSLTVTDRPVYRPGQTLQFKTWLGKTDYALFGKESLLSDQKVRLVIRNPRGEEVSDLTYSSDNFGAFHGKFEISVTAPLGQYYGHLKIGNNHIGNFNFRVEEYKKPEYEVSIELPTKPVELGETFTAKVKAKYYFGQPVTEGEVTVKVMRHEHEERWFPWHRWDWLYGNGFWWFTPEYSWYRGWNDWGCERPQFFWWHRPQPRPEVVANLKGQVNEHGEFEVILDTALAKKLYGDKNQRYEITATVRDASRQTIDGSGSVIVAAKPFKVYTWLDRGYYKVGDQVTASIQARTADGKNIAGMADFTLFKIEDEKEKEVAKWTNQSVLEGAAELSFSASTAGRFRVVSKVTAKDGKSIEGAVIFTVIGQGFDSRDYQYNGLELITDKTTYQPGETVKLQINTEQPDSTVFLFVRAENGVLPKPQVIKLNGKSTLVEIPVTQGDKPNFFVEALTIANGKVHNQVRMIAVPPEKRALNVEVLPSAEKFKPGEKATVKLKLTDLDGQPFVGSMALTVYDKSLEYIAPNQIPDIKKHFWNWHRHHHMNQIHSLQMNYGHLAQIKPFSLNSSATDSLHYVTKYTGSMTFYDVRMGSGRSHALMVKSMDSPMAQSANSVLVDDFGATPELGGPSEQPAVTVRQNFADTAYWNAQIVTDENGEATLSFPMPENLTTWKIMTWGVGDNLAVGSGSAEIITAKDFILRLQAPRFFVEKDEVVLSAIIHNYLDSDREVTVALELEGDSLKATEQLTRKVSVTSKGETRVDWTVKAIKAGAATVRMKAITTDDSDAMQMEFPVLVHGAEKMEAFCGQLRDDEKELTFDLTIPAERRVDETKLEVRFSPSLAMSMIDALPFLATYPHGCTEQTLNRFLPTVITRKLLKEMNIDLGALEKAHSNLNAQQLGNPSERAKQWQHDHKQNPVYSEAEVLKMTKTGVERLTALQNSDGGWGWFGGDRSYPHTTAVVLRGLLLAKANGAAVVPSTLQRGEQWLKRYQDEQLKERQNYVKWARSDKKDEKLNALPKKSYLDNMDALVASILPQNADYNQFLYIDREHLSHYGKALTALAIHAAGNQAEQVEMLDRNLRQFVTYDEENQTAYLEGNQSYWWYWYGSDIEANATYLKLLCKLSPADKVTAGLVKYLLNNRRHGYYWNSTRDTALCLEAFADYIRATGEDQPDQTVEILLDGQVLKTVKVTAENLFTFDNTLTLSGKALACGKHQLSLRKTGKGPLYANAYLSYFSLEDFITKAGLEVKVERRYYKITERTEAGHGAGKSGNAVGKTLEKTIRTPLKTGDAIASGDQIEVELIIESKNDYEYLLLEDFKAAGFEPISQQSGYSHNGMPAYVEYRDTKVCFYMRWLPRGKHNTTYRMRAVTPGTFSALPAQVSAMYAPELRGNSDELKIGITD